jgi:hypothetical protein
MARLSSIFFIILFAFAFHLAPLDGRKILRDQGLSPPSSSGEKVDHPMAINESMIFSHLAKMDRILQSAVPSPGAGH